MNNFVLYGMMFTVVSLGLASVLLFRLILTRTQKHHRSIKYFIGFFVCASLAFVAFSLIDQGTGLSLKNQTYSSVALFFNTLLYVSALLSLRHGLIIRKVANTEPLWLQPFFYVNVIIACFIQHAMFNYFPEYHPYRISLLNLQLGLIFLSCSPYVSGDVFGEKMMRYAMYLMVGSLVIMSVPLFFESTYRYYHVAVMSAQALNYHVWMGMLFILLLADTIETHYQNSIIDTLTGLHNRRFFMEKLRHTQSCATAESYSSMIVCDIDHFKRINDQHGHDMGDKVIHQFAAVLDKEVRKEDFLARIGGEEFAVFLPQTPLVVAEQIAQRMCDAVHALEIKGIGGVKLMPTGSFGVASLFGQASPSEFINAADRAMYQAKSAGRNCVRTAVND